MDSTEVLTEQRVADSRIAAAYAAVSKALAAIDPQLPRTSGRMMRAHVHGIAEQTLNAVHDIHAIGMTRAKIHKRVAKFRDECGDALAQHIVFLAGESVTERKGGRHG